MTTPGHNADRDLARYSRQMLFERIGEAGQRRLRHASVTLVGCGALGSVLASTLVRAGVGSLRIVDRDFIELDNLQRQILFDEHDIAQNLPKAEAAARKLHRVNSAVEIEPVVADVNPGNAEALCAGADLLLDGTDNLETRYLLNDVAVKHGVPWVYGACLGAEGLVMPIRPRKTPCLRCLWEEPPAPGTLATCDTAGVLAAAVQIVASLQATEAMKILMGREEELIGAIGGLREEIPADRGARTDSRTRVAEPGRGGCLTAIDAWAGRLRTVNVQAAYDEGNCPCCKQNRYEFLEGGQTAAATTLCGRNAIQILPPQRQVGGLSPTQVDFKAIAARLPTAARPKLNEFMLKFTVDAGTVTLFRDGRAIVQGTSDPAVARGLYAKYVGT